MIGGRVFTTLALKAGLWFRRGLFVMLFVMLSPVHGNLRRVQAEFPLIRVVQISRASFYLEIEETLANGNVLREVVARVGPDIADTLRHFIRKQPPGYKDGELAESNQGFSIARRSDASPSRYFHGQPTGHGSEACGAAAAVVSVPEVTDHGRR